jgi:hypothetical protein
MRRTIGLVGLLACVISGPNSSYAEEMPYAISNILKEMDSEYANLEARLGFICFIAEFHAARV